MNIDPHHHLDSDVLQALAEGELPGESERHARAHLDSCARCRAEMEGWTLLFRDLDGLPDLRPAPEFAARVMTKVEIPTRAESRSSMLARLLDRIPGFRKAPADRHVSVQGIQDLLENQLARGTRLRVEAHLGSCTDCESLVREWATLFSRIEEIPRLEPSRGFAERVMAEVQVVAIAEVSRTPKTGWLERALGAGRALLPSSPKGWAVAGALFAAPSVGLIAAVAAVVAHPLLSLRELVLFLSWRASELGGLAWAWSLDVLTATPGVYQMMEALRALTETPGLAAAGVLALWATTMTAAWVLYRYIVAPTLSTGHHAKLS